MAKKSGYGNTRRGGLEGNDGIVNLGLGNLHLCLRGIPCDVVVAAVSDAKVAAAVNAAEDVVVAACCRAASPS